MHCCLTDLRDKEVINSKNACKLGNVCDVEIDSKTGQVVALIIFGRSRFFGINGKEDDIRICWDDIQVIGEDTILVCIKNDPPPRPKKKNILEGLFR